MLLDLCVVLFVFVMCLLDGVCVLCEFVVVLDV